MSTTVTDLQVAHFRAFGFTVARGAVDAGPLSAEFDRCLAAGFDWSASSNSGATGIELRYLPLMTDEAPVSLALLDRFATDAARLLETAVLPVRAKAVRYVGAAGWHADSDLDLPSVGFACYLETVDADTGALRVLPGSHERPDGSPMADLVDGFMVGDQVPTVEELPGTVVATEPGDVIIFDEHLFHASSGGATRRQWRVDFIADPADAEEEAVARRYFAAMYSPDWDGGYDVDRFPTYGPSWRRSRRAGVDRLAALGAYDLCDAEEAFARSNRPASSPS